jgi:phage baseplate assembly protein V
MMSKMLNVMRAQSQMAESGRASVRLAIVSSYDPGSYCVKVRIQPEDTDTGWLPVVSPWVGNGWGLFAPPSIGDLVEVQFQEDDFEAGFVCQRFYNDDDRPLSVESGEFWLVHKSGAFFKLTNDGKALINGQVEIDATAPTINITATGNITAQAGGNATVQAAGSATIQAPSIILKNAGSALKKLCTEVFMTLFNGHTHISATAGSPTSSPIQQATAGTHTTNIVQAE